MAGEARGQMIAELLDDYIEERVRQFPNQAFDLASVRRALQQLLKEGEAGDLGPGDDKAIAQKLDQHPFLVRAPGAAASWKPGLDKRPRKPAAGRR
jgi:hypothetical protein